ncbi:hypothetical protein [Haloarchaeobius sp. HRN-SO-5]|uniref:hypothetical protein n=1 Tax=Haloarchaeobius sp. HRN-SO-5 TaxID=3446118 RepID=UPI003EB6A0A0
MSVERPQPGRLERSRQAVENRLYLTPLRFPPEWAMSSSWHRAQAAPATCGPVNATEFDVLIGYPDSDDLGDRHRVTFTIHQGNLLAHCGCHGWTYHDWCAHVAYLWWQWSRARLGVTDLDTGSVYHEPPVWLRVDDPARPTASATRARTDGGDRR